MKLPFPVFEGHSAAESLSMSFDGRIPDGYRQLARAWDGLHPVKHHDFAVRIGRVTPKPRTILLGLIAAAEQALTRSGSVSLQDFRRAGYSEADINAHGEAAIGAMIVRTPAFADLMAEAA